MISEGLTPETRVFDAAIMAEVSMTLRHLDLEISERALPRLDRPATTP